MPPTKSCARPTRKFSPATKSCKAPTKSWRPPRRNCSRPTKKAMNLLPGDIGRPISDSRPSAQVPDLESLLIEVIDKVQPAEREVRDREGRCHILRVYPYRTADQKIDGAVITLVDIDEIK